MAFHLAEWLQDFLGRVRPADLLDVLLVAALLYAVITWLRTGASRAVVMLVGAVVALLILARVLSLYLTQMIVEALLTVSIIAFVVLFRDEIRRELDRLTARRRRRRPSDGFGPMIDTLVTAATHMAHRRIGALIVIAGREEWQRNTTGGVPLDGNISEPLLYSIFNPDSPGHDGAVMIDRGRIQRFAVHLPLSRNMQAVAGRGTRHTAALGMAEVCDAMIVVVSEERGEISVAHAGRIETLESTMQLTERLSTFCRKHLSSGEDVKQSRERWKKAGVAAVSLALAGMLWGVFAYQSDMLVRTYQVPIEFRNPPQGYELEDAGLIEARVVVGGPAQAFRQFDHESLTLQVDLSDITLGENVLVLQEEGLELPSDLELYRVDPATVWITAHQSAPERPAVTPSPTPRTPPQSPPPQGSQP